MTGKELVKLLKCIMEEQKVQWGRGSLLNPHSHRYCALGLLAKGAGVPDDMIRDSVEGAYPTNSTVLASIVTINDGARSFESFCDKLEKDTRNFEVEEHLKNLKKLAKGA